MQILKCLMWLSCKYLSVHSLSSRILIVITSSVWLPCHVFSQLWGNKVSAFSLSWPEALSLWVQSLWGANWAARQRQLGKLDYCDVLIITMYLSRILLRLNNVVGWLCTPVSVPPPCNKCTRFTDRCMCAHTCAFMHACSQKCRCPHNHMHTHTCIYLHLSLTCSTIHTYTHPMW